MFHFPKTVDEVDQVIGVEFIIREKSYKANIPNIKEKFGYLSVHYLVSLTDERTVLPEYV